MLTYNGLLYTERTNRRLSRRKMAKFLGIFKYSYSMIEQGYIKPNKKQVEKISKALNIDYSQYVKNDSSYPSELPEKKRNKVVAFFYKVVGHLIFKIVFGVLAGASIGFMVSGFIVQNNVDNNKRSFYSEEYLTFVDNLKENGSIHFSLYGSFWKPEYRLYEKDDVNKTSKLISILGDYEDVNIESLHFIATYRNEESRLVYTITPYQQNDEILYDLSMKYSEYDSAIVLNTSIYHGISSNSVILTKADSTKGIIYPGDERYDDYWAKLTAKMDVYENDFNQLISEKDPTFAGENPNKLDYLGKLLIEGNNKKSPATVYAFFARYFGIVLSGLNVFIFIYALLYGTTKKGEKIYKTTQLDVPVDEVHRLKSDIKICPFIPETILEIIGIILVFIGSFRTVFYVSSYLYSNSAATISTNVGPELMQIFMVGMFLLYFIDFDIFMDDKRVLRNIFLYTIVFFCLYGLENLIYRILIDESIIGQAMTFVSMPNMFGTIACYYLIMFFLYFNPELLKNKKKVWMIIFRCLSILPAAWIFVCWYLYNGNGVFFDADWPLEVKNLFNGEKIPFSLLAVTYLFALYFLRLFFEKRMGKEKASVFFNGNKFLWIKNGIVAAIIATIGIVEIILKNNITANKVGLGMYSNILFLIPLLMFYHPHKGPRNLILDWTTLGLYIIAISLSYVAVILMIFTRFL